MPPGIRPAFVRGGYSAYLVCAVVFRLERMWDLTFYLLRAMQCITNFFQRVPEAGGPWLWKVPRLFEPRIASHEEAKHVGGSERAHTAALAADSLNTLTGRGAGGDRWRPMTNGADKTEKWTAKAYVNYTQADLAVHILGPLKTKDEDKRVKVVIPGGHALVSTVVETATGKQHFARNFGSNIGTKGIVFAGIVGFVPQQAEPAPPVPPLSQGSVASSYQRGPRTRASLQRERLQNLNDAYLKMHEEPFECLVLGERKWGANAWGINPSVIMRLFTYLRSRLFPIFARKTT